MKPIRTNRGNRVQFGFCFSSSSSQSPYIIEGTPKGEINLFELGFCQVSLLRRHRSPLHPESRRAPAIGRAGLRNPSSSRSCTGRGRIRFLGSASRDCSRSSPRVVYLLRLRGDTANVSCVEFFTTPTSPFPTSSAPLVHQFRNRLCTEEVFARPDPDCCVFLCFHKPTSLFMYV